MQQGCNPYRWPSTLAAFLPSCRVTEIEAQRLEETREDRERFLAELRAELERQAAQKGVKLALPPTPHSSSSSSSSSNSSSGGMSRQ